MAKFFDDAIGPLILARIPRRIHPHHLTVARFALLGPLILAGPGWPAVGIVAASSACDLLDGPLARFRGQTSKLGEMLDPISDKLFLLPALYLLCWTQLPQWLFWTILGFDVALTVLRPVKDAYDVTSKSNSWGAAKVWMQSIGLGLLLMRSPTLEPLGVPALGLAVIFAALSLAWHIRDFTRTTEQEPA